MSGEEFDWAELFLWACLTAAVVVVVVLPCLSWLEERSRVNRRIRKAGAIRPRSAQDYETENRMQDRIREQVRAGALVK